MNASYRYTTHVQWETSEWEPPRWVDMDAGRVTLDSTENLPMWLTAAPSSPEEILAAALACAAELAVDESRALWIAAAADGPSTESIHERRPPLALAVRARVASSQSDSQPAIAELSLTIPEPTAAEVVRHRGAPLAARTGAAVADATDTVALFQGKSSSGLHFTLEVAEPDCWALTLNDGAQEAATLHIEAETPTAPQAAALEQATLLEPWAETLRLLAAAERVRGPQASAAVSRSQRETNAELQQAAAEALPDAVAGPLPTFVRSWSLGGPARPYGLAWSKLYPVVVQQWAKTGPAEGQANMIRWAIEHGCSRSYLYWDADIPLHVIAAALAGVSK